MKTNRKRGKYGSSHCSRALFFRFDAVFHQEIVRDLREKPRHEFDLEKAVYLLIVAPHRIREHIPEVLPRSFSEFFHLAEGGRVDDHGPPVGSQVFLQCRIAPSLAVQQF
ncbi:MAG: hypothetical protein WC765_01555 [Phycisphaerae bacterium]